MDVPAMSLNHDATKAPRCRQKRPGADAMKPDFQRVRTRWIRGFIAFRPLRRTRIVMLMVSV
jgi:hypothetical protein